MFSFIHAADIHLDSPMLRLEGYEGAPVDQIRQATRRALDNLVNLAISEKVDFVLISGDLYDGDWKDYNTGLYFLSRMKRLAEAAIPVFFIAGNHDAANKMTKSLRMPEGIHTFGSKAPATFYVEEAGAAIHGQSFPSGAVNRDLSSDYPAAIKGYFNIGMLHTSATGSSDHDPYAPCSVEGLRMKGYDYWALGHIHKRQTLCQDPPILFPGNLQGRNIRETGEKGCMLVKVENGRPGYEFFPLDVFRWAQCEADVTGEQTESGVLEKIMSSVSAIACESDLSMALRVNVTGACPVHDRVCSDPERLANSIRAEAISMLRDRVWIEKVKLNTSPPAGEALDGAGGPVEVLLKMMDEIGADTDLLEELGGCLNDLWMKLPSEIRSGETAVCPKDPAAIARLLHEVRPMLVQRLGISK
ncbi:MAG: DNA repair exonuclease [Syntrophobacteraceae bacterium]|nr:DNA repair exonuclease [Syntrophobacteraceae bacterium]